MRLLTRRTRRMLRNFSPRDRFGSFRSWIVRRDAFVSLIPKRLGRIIFFYQLGKIAEKRIGRISEDRIKNGFTRQNVATDRRERIERRHPVFLSSAADTVGKKRDVELLADRRERSLINADCRFDSGDNQMVDFFFG